MNEQTFDEPEAGGNWFVLCVEPTPIILAKARIVEATAAFDGDLLQALSNDGYSPYCDENGNWISFALRSDVGPSYIPDSIRHVSRFVSTGTVLTLDNGCWPSLQWRFGAQGITVVDTFDELDSKTTDDRG